MTHHDISLLSLGAGIGVYLAFIGFMVGGLLADNRQARRDSLTLQTKD
jgi:xanthine/uracil/vitamin C permease (AzgA family)